MQDETREILENQIGDMGSTEAVEQKTLGKAKLFKHNEDKDRDDAFKQRANQAFENERLNSDFRYGWIDVDKDVMGERALYYPESWQFRIRPASVSDIKNWSAVNEDNVISVNAVLNEIIKSCVSITTPSGNISPNNIYSWDRFWFILKVREYTFAKAETVVEFEDECSECGQMTKFTLSPQTLYWEYPDQDIFEKYWNREDRTWYINPVEFNLEGGMIKLYPPTIEKDNAITNWIYKRVQQNKNINESFLRFLPWMMKKASKDEKLLEKQILECEAYYKQWSVDMFDFIDDVIRNIEVVPKETLQAICSHCGMEVHSNIQFPSGIKNLFKTPDNKYKKFGSK